MNETGGANLPTSRPAVPSPASAAEGRRTEQVNRRLTTAEQVDLENATRAAGFPTVSDFVRAAAVGKAAAAGKCCL